MACPSNPRLNVLIRSVRNDITPNVMNKPPVNPISLIVLFEAYCFACESLLVVYLSG